MTTRIYVGNLPAETTEKDVEGLFHEHGEVLGVSLANDRASGRFRGFAFVEMRDERAADAAISGLSGLSYAGRTLKVSRARAATKRGGAQGRW